MIASTLHNTGPFGENNRPEYNNNHHALADTTPHSSIRRQEYPFNHGDDGENASQVNPYAGIVHSDATVRSGHTRAKDQILGSNETAVKYATMGTEPTMPIFWVQIRR